MSMEVANGLLDDHSSLYQRGWVFHFHDHFRECHFDRLGEFRALHLSDLPAPSVRSAMLHLLELNTGKG